MVVVAAAEEEEAAVVASTATTTIRTTGSHPLTTSSHEHLRPKQAPTAKLIPMHPVSITPPPLPALLGAWVPSRPTHHNDASNR